MKNKRTLWPVPVAVLGGLAIGVALYFLLFNTINKNLLDQEGPLVAGPKPQVGHWLKTVEDKEEPPPQSVHKKLVSQSVVKEKNWPALNRTTSNVNILYLWTEGRKPKVISVMTMNEQTGKAAIVIMPLFARIEWQGRTTTIEKMYNEGGRQAVREFLQKKLEVKLPYFVNVEQRALVKISDIVGPFSVDGEQMTMADAFEQTALGIRHNDQDIVRAVARQTFKPHILLNIPKLIWIFTHDITTNLNTEDMLGLYRLSRDINLGKMLKVVLPGEEQWSEEEKILLVEERTWQNIIYDVSN